MTIKHLKFADAILQITFMEILETPHPLQKYRSKIKNRICNFQENSAEQDRDA